MSDVFVGQISIFGFNFPPKGFAACDGQILQIAQNQALYALIGTSFGGDGITTFALPNLQGRAPAHADGKSCGVSTGEVAHTLTTQEIPDHIHGVMAVNAVSATVDPTNNVLANTSASIYTPWSAATATTLNPATLGTVGGPHDNMQPYLPLNFCIALQGIFPPRN